MGMADGRYGGIRSKHPTLAARAAMEAARRVSAIHPEDEEEYDEDQEDEQRPNFAERFLLGMSLCCRLVEMLIFSQRGEHIQHQ
jgi:hypothetical protein